MDVDILSSQLTLDKASKLVLCSLNHCLRRHPDILLLDNSADIVQQR